MAPQAFVAPQQQVYYQPQTVIAAAPQPIYVQPQTVIAAAPAAKGKGFFGKKLLLLRKQ